MNGANYLSGTHFKRKLFNSDSCISHMCHKYNEHPYSVTEPCLRAARRDIQRCRRCIVDDVARHTGRSRRARTTQLKFEFLLSSGLFVRSVSFQIRSRTVVFLRALLPPTGFLPCLFNPAEISRLFFEAHVLSLSTLPTNSSSRKFSFRFRSP